MAVSPDITREILGHIQDNRVMPKSLPGVDPEDLHNEFTRLWRKGLITSDREPIVTGIDNVVRDVIEPRPRLFGRDRRRQNNRKPARCQAITVSGLTMTRTLLHAGQRRRSRTQNIRLWISSRGRECFRLNTASC